VRSLFHPLSFQVEANTPDVNSSLNIHFSLPDYVVLL
jgi:hypothetical protein